MNFLSHAARPAVLVLGILATVAHAQNKPIRLRNELILPNSAAQLAPAQAADAWALISGLYLLQFRGPVQPAWQEQLQGLRVELLRYVPEDAFVARLDNIALQQLRSLPFVAWIGEYRPGHKMHPALSGIQQAGDGEDVGVSILLSPKVLPAERAGVLRSLRLLQPESAHRLGAVLRGRIARRSLATLAQSPGVLWIEPGPKMKLFDETASRIVAGDGPENTTYTQSLGFDGRGVTVAVADSGLDTGEADDMHPDLLGRVSAFFFYGNLADASDEHSHGTHVAGIIGGSGATGEKDEAGALFGLGVAPGVSIVAQRLFGAAGNYEAPPTFETMTRDAKSAGADIGSNSWGDDTQGRYDISAMEFDALVRDADALSFGDQPYILEFSAGNAGPGAQTIGSPAVAKNVIATGASQNNRFDLPLPEFPIYDTGQDTMADFSSRGPCEDGRIKPDVVAPGSWIASLRSEYANDDFAWWPISDDYMYQGGTSQAGPHVSGAAAVFVQYWRETRTNQTPSPALVKAALINAAVDMDDFVETDPVPNMDEGWGRVDLTQIIDAPREYEFVDQAELLSTGGTAERRVLVDDLEEPLKVTLVYTDVPGFPGAIPALVNDLDLEIVGPDGAVYRGNRFELGESVPNAATADTINNVEAVHLLAPLPGEYVVRVRARNVVQDARTDTGAVDQDFALVISGSLARLGTGVISFDRRTYTAPAVLQLKLFDQSLAGQPSAAILLKSTTEASGENIVLQAIGGSGVFTAAVTTAVGPAVSNSRLEISHGDTIEAIYQDANPAATRRFTARADLQPPVVSGVFADFEFGRVNITWDTDEEASGIVRYGTDTLNLSVTNRFFEIDHEVAITNAAPNVTYRFIVVAEDRAGNRATNDNGGAHFTFTPIETPTVLIVDAYYNDLFEVPPLAGYTEALDRLGVSYEVWETETAGPVSVDLLAPYRCVIWRVPEFSLGTTWSTPEAQVVASYLAGGGSLLMASMEFLSRLEEGGFTSFARDIFQVQSFVPDTGAPSATGAGGELIGAGIDVTLDYTPYADEIKEFVVGIPADASDTISATTNGSPILLSGADVVGVRSPRIGLDQPGRVVFLSFPLDAVPMGAGIGNNRPGLLRNILNFLAPQEGSRTIALDRDVYTAPGLATVELEDVDIGDQGIATVRCYSPRQVDGVAVTLAETARRGLFRGTIPLVLMPRANAGSELLVKSGDTFRVEYLDGAGEQTLTVTGRVETDPPLISNVAVEPGYVDASVTWDTSEATDALVQFSDSPGNFPINFTAFDPAFDFFHELTLERLKPEHTYYFRVVSRDRAGNVRIDDNNGDLYSFTTLLPLIAPWRDDLERGATDWAVVSPEESEIEWTLGVPGNGASAPSPVNAWGSNLDGGMAALAESFLISPALLLSGGGVATLRFKQNYNFLPQREFDIDEYGEVLLITNTTTSPVLLGTVRDLSEDWEDAEFDLTPYRDQVVYVVWHYLLVSFEDAPRFGWLLDDISVSVTNIIPGTVRITNNLWQARYILSGPANRSGQGETLVLSNAPPGEYRITFGDVPHYTTPASQTNTLAALSTLVFHGHYLMADVNENGMADSWEQQEFGSVSPERTRLTDTDSDGFTDYAEFVAGTDPMASDSRLVLVTRATVLNDRARLEWPSENGRAYRVEGSRDAVHWGPMSDWLQARAGVTAFEVPLPASGEPYLFRVEVRP